MDPMTTPRGDGSQSAEPSRHADDETRVDVPVTRDNAQPNSRPPTFPSVGGPSGPTPRTPQGAYFNHVQDGGATDVASTAAVPEGQLSAPVGGRTGRLRWLAAGMATILVLVLVGGTLFFLGTRPATPSLVSQFAPSDSAAFVEIRLDMPGDQRDRLATFMGHFPGFADPASFQQKIDETLSNALRATDSGLEWKVDVDPWFGGQIGVFSSSLEPGYGLPPSFAIVLSVKDKAKLDELVTARLTQSDMTPEDYNGVTIYSGEAAPDGERINMAVTDEALLISARSEDLKTALDVRGGKSPGLADDAFFLGQLSAMHEDRLALVYYDYSSLFEAMPAGTEGIRAQCAPALLAATDIKLVAEMRAEADHLEFNMRSQYPSGEGAPPAPGNKRTALAERMPAGTVAYMEMRQVGANIKYLVEQALDCMLPTTLGGMDLGSIQQLLGVPPQDYFDFLQDAAIGVTFTGADFGGGIVATVDDENVARARVERLLSALRLAGGLGGGITFEEVLHGDATITVINLGTGLATAAEAPSISVTVTGGLLYLGMGDFVESALDRTSADSLAAAPRLQSALSSAGADNAGIVYVDVGAIRRGIETQFQGMPGGDYESETKPFVEPLTHFIVVSRNEGGFNGGHAFLYVE